MTELKRASRSGQLELEEEEEREGEGEEERRETHEEELDGRGEELEVGDVREGKAKEDSDTLGEVVENEVPAVVVGEEGLND